MSNMNFLYENVTNKILKILESGVSPWRKTWKSSELPTNLTTKIPYHGINVWTLLSSPSSTTSLWATWNQIMALGGTVKKEEAKNYEIIVFWKPLKYKKIVGGIEEEDTFPMIRYSRVYNLSQVELPADVMKKLIPEKEVKQVNKLENCEAIITNYKDKPETKYGGDRAYYACLFDKIQMPLHEDFDNDEEYYSTWFHEMAHSTGAEKRLNRFKATDSHIFGSDRYSKEELIAEMTASFLCAEAGIENSIIENSAAYIQSWMKAIKEGDKNFVISAASRAQRAADYILQRIHKDN